MKVINRIEQAKRLLDDIRQSGRFFGVDFIKRTTGEKRQMTGKSIEDTLNDYDDERDLMTVFDPEAGHPKSVNVPGITEIRHNGQTFKFDL